MNISNRSYILIHCSNKSDVTSLTMIYNIECKNSITFRKAYLYKSDSLQCHIIFRIIVPTGFKTTTSNFILSDNRYNTHKFILLFYFHLYIYSKTNVCSYFFIKILFQLGFKGVLFYGIRNVNLLNCCECVPVNLKIKYAKTDTQNWHTKVIMFFVIHILLSSTTKPLTLCKWTKRTPLN